MSWKEWDQGEVVEAGDLQEYIQDQVVQNYADSAARSTALGTAVAEGMVSYLQDSNSVEVYDGSAWQAVAPVSHNYIINGAFDIWQRGSSFTNPQNNSFAADRFYVGWSGTPTGTLTRAEFTEGELEVASFGGAKYYWDYQNATLGGVPFIDLRHTIEDVETLAGQTVTLSLYAKSNDSITIQPIQLQSFGSGGSSNTNQVQSSQSLTSSWARYTWTYTIPSNSGKTIGSGSYQAIFLRFASLTDTFDVSIWGVQLEAGSIATPFKRNANSIQGELAACKRYYQRTVGQTITNLTYYNSTDAYGALRYDEMRRIPDFNKSGDTNFTVLSSNNARTSSTVSASFISKDSLQLLAATTSATQGDGAWLRANSSTDFIELDAEL